MSTPTEEFEAPTRSGIDRRLIAGVGALVVVLLALLWFVFLRGSPEPAETAAPAPQAAPEPAPEPEREEPARRPGGGGPVETFQVFAPRDPFEPLVSADDSAAAAGGTGATVDTGGGVITNDSGNGGGDAGAGGDSGGSTIGTHTVSVVDVFAAGARRRAQIEVDGTVYKVSEGETFADSFELLSASGECAGLLYGDDQFTLCEGEEILK
jgi:hypothetical protein